MTLSLSLSLCAPYPFGFLNLISCEEYNLGMRIYFAFCLPVKVSILFLNLFKKPGHMILPVLLPILINNNNSECLSRYLLEILVHFYDGFGVQA